MLTKKQELFFKFLVNCYQKEKKYPSIGFLKENSHYHSYNTIYKYLDQLEKKGYIKRNKKKEIIYIKECLENTLILHIPVINENKTISFTTSFLNANKKYIAFQIHDNKLNKDFLKNGDILIIEKTKKIYNKNLVFVELENKYCILRYIKKDGFIHLFNDKESFILNNFTKITGKVCFCIRNNC